jgi:hypothetical protein
MADWRHNWPLLDSTIEFAFISIARSAMASLCRGALNGLMAELIEGHLKFHVLPPESSAQPSQLEAAEELMTVGTHRFG